MLCGLLHTQGRAKSWSEALGIYTAVRRLSDAQDWAVLAELFTDYFNGDGSWAAAPAERQSVIVSQLPPNRHEWDASSQPITAQDFGSVTALTLVLRDSRTRLVTKKIADVLCQAFPHWQLQEIQDAGHMGPLTHGATVNAKIQSVLALPPWRRTHP